jgi:hypothetical protein
LPNKTVEIQEVGRLLITKFAGAFFVIKGKGARLQKFEFPISTFESMINNSDFQPLGLQAKQATRSTNIDIMLRFPNGELYSISGFPRPLIGIDGQTRGTASSLHVCF